MAAGLGALYDGLVTTFHAMAELITFRAVGLGQVLERHFMTLRILNNAAIIGIGYIVGIRYAAIICAGSFLSYFVLVPLVHAIGVYVPNVLPPGGIPIAEMTHRPGLPLLRADHRRRRHRRRRHPRHPAARCPRWCARSAPTSSA